MIFYRLGVLPVLVIVSIIAAPAGNVPVVREDGAGPVKIGMSLPQLNRVLHESMLQPDEEGLDCFSVTPTHYPHIAFMILDFRLARSDVLGCVLQRLLAFRLAILRRTRYRCTVPN